MKQLLLAELGTLAIVWWVGSRGASSSANLQTLVAVLIVAPCRYLVGGRYPKRDSLPGRDRRRPLTAFAALSVMFWCFVGQPFAHLASEFKQPERDFPAH
jgi:amino acid efflux transporter